MPAGLGKTTRIAVLCSDSLKETLGSSGVDQFIDGEAIK